MVGLGEVWNLTSDQGHLVTRVGHTACGETRLDSIVSISINSIMSYRQKVLVTSVNLS